MRAALMSVEFEIVIILATHNGADVLDDVLTAYLKMDKIEQKWALIIVNNGSTDNTSSVIDKYKNLLPLILLHETTPGKSVCLNKALNASQLKPNFYIFTDDDAIPDSQFLSQWEKAALRLPACEIFGGVIEVLFRHSPPNWLHKFSNHYPELYAENKGPEGAIIPEKVFGPNMAVRRSVFERGYKFNEAIGPNQSDPNYPMGSETDFCVRAAKSSPNSPWFVTGPKVHHIVRENQLQYKYIGERAYRHGRGRAIISPIKNNYSRQALYNLKLIIKIALLFIASSASYSTSWWSYNWYRGYASFHFNQRRHSIRKVRYKPRA